MAWTHTFRVVYLLAFLNLGVCVGQVPQVISLFPLGGTTGAVVEAEVRGKSLGGIYAVWFDRQGIRALVRRVEDVQPVEQEDPAPEAAESERVQKALLRLSIDPSAQAGVYSLRLVSDGGISNPLVFRVHEYPSWTENTITPSDSQSERKVEFPVAIQARISRPGERDRYSFEVQEGQELWFDVTAKPASGALAGPAGFDAELTLYENSGSWFDPDRINRLTFVDKSKPDAGENPQFQYRFRRSGRYLIQVKSFLNLGGPDYSYQLRITSSPPPTEAGALAKIWRERDFSRPLGPGRMRELWARSAANPSSESQDPAGTDADLNPERPAAVAEPIQVFEQEPNDELKQAMTLTLPAVLQGCIERPGDRDHASFQVEQGQELVFEMETPSATVPRFNPHLSIIDGDGREVVSNVYRRILRQSLSYGKTVEAKTVYTFQLGGIFHLRIQDVTLRRGDPSFVYRVLIRPAIPHIGELRLQEDRLNLAPGKAGTVTVTVGQEEGFDGGTSLWVEDLPAGVTASAGSTITPDAPRPLDEGPKERYLPRLAMATIVIMAAPKAPLTRDPRSVRIRARPVVDGKLGPDLLVGELPLMVINGSR